MSRPASPLTETPAAAAFSRQSAHFDSTYGSNDIIAYKRARVRAATVRWLRPGSRILELNAGTGEDALYLAGQGHRVHATDLSTGMLEALGRKVRAAGAGDSVTWEQCSFEALDGLQHRGPFDHLFSNFGGLNCTGDLPSVLRQASVLLRPGGTATLVIIPPFCLWETLLLFKGEFRTALRRFFSHGGRTATIDGLPFTCWYYSPRAVRRMVAEEFDVLDLEGLCTLVPPSYRERFPQRWPRLYRILQRLEDRFKSSRPWRGIGDYFIITLRKKS
ncbi:class I SAM-dependent methyltransferase [Flaviaesturariibacter amylovorans]|uniref:Methyltransferase domain-containing protein n=1 Tax=Flaviaesturariibacter amylovorans TaxID=1084520 RepID=A0ABP8HF04_9BACT